MATEKNSMELDQGDIPEELLDLLDDLADIGAAATPEKLDQLLTTLVKVVESFQDKPR